MKRTNRSETAAGGVPVINVRRAAAILVVVGLLLGPAPGARAVFDDLELSPRARGLGGAYAGLSNDAAGLFYNPAGLVNVEGIDVYTSLFHPFNYAFSRANLLAVAWASEEWGTFGFGYSDFRVDYDGAVLSIESTYSFGHALMLMEDLSSSFAFGYAINLYHLDYPTLSVSGYDLGAENTYGVDLGFQGKLHERTTVGFFVENVNNPSIGDPKETELSQRLSGGIAYQAYDGVITAAEVEKEFGEDVQFHAGIECRIAAPLVLRFGAQSEPNLFDVGAGFGYKDVQTDFTYTYHPVLDATFHYGLGLRF